MMIRFIPDLTFFLVTRQKWWWDSTLHFLLRYVTPRIFLSCHNFSFLISPIPSWATRILDVIYFLGQLSRMMIGFLTSLSFWITRQEWWKDSWPHFLFCSPPRMMIGFLTSLSFLVTRQELWWDSTLHYDDRIPDLTFLQKNLIVGLSLVCRIEQQRS
jgi:hypothetical protein